MAQMGLCPLLEGATHTAVCEVTVVLAESLLHSCPHHRSPEQGSKAAGWLIHFSFFHLLFTQRP